MKAVGDLSVIYRASLPGPLGHRLPLGAGRPGRVRPRHAASRASWGRCPSPRHGRPPWSTSALPASPPRASGYTSGLLTMLVAPFSKLLAVLVAIPTPRGQRGVRHHLRHALRRRREDGPHGPGGPEEGHHRRRFHGAGPLRRGFQRVRRRRHQPAGGQYALLRRYDGHSDDRIRRAIGLPPRETADRPGPVFLACR